MKNPFEGTMPSMTRAVVSLTDTVTELASHIEHRRWASAEKYLRDVLSQVSKMHQRVRLIVELQEDGVTALE